MGERPIFLLDMDNVIAGFDDAIFRLAEEHGFHIDLDGYEDPKRKYFLTENMPDPSHANALRTIINSTRFFLDLPVVPGALDGVAELMEYFDVWICTKPLEANPWCRDDKALWLRKWFPHLEHKAIMTPKKSLVHGDILLDDAPHQNCIHRASWIPVVFEQPYNISNPIWKDCHRWTWGQPIEYLINVISD